MSRFGAFGLSFGLLAFGVVGGLFGFSVKSNKDLIAENENITIEYQTAQEQIKEYKSLINSLQSSIQEKEALIGANVEQIEILQTTIESNNLMIERLQEDVALNEAEINRLIKDNESKQGLISECVTSIQVLENEKQELMSELNNYDSQLTTLQTTYLETLDQLEKKQNKINKIFNDIESTPMLFGEETSSLSLKATIGENYRVFNFSKQPVKYLSNDIKEYLTSNSEFSEVNFSKDIKYILTILDEPYMSITNQVYQFAEDYNMDFKYKLNGNIINSLSEMEISDILQEKSNVSILVDTLTQDSKNKITDISFTLIIDQLPVIYTMEEGIKTIELYDENNNYAVTDLNSDTTTLNMSNIVLNFGAKSTENNAVEIPEGNYFLKVTTEDGKVYYAQEAINSNYYNSEITLYPSTRLPVYCAANSYANPMENPLVQGTGLFGTAATGYGYFNAETKELTFANSMYYTDPIGVIFNGVEYTGSAAGLEQASEYTIQLTKKVEIISFTIDGVEYTAEEGMTFGEWIASEYNTDSYCIGTESPYWVLDNSGTMYVFGGIGVGNVAGDTIIIESYSYATMFN